MPKTSITNRGYGIEKCSLGEEGLRELKDALTVKPYVSMQIADGDQNQKSFPVYLESSKKIYVPKYYGLCKYGVPNEEKVADGVDVSIGFQGSLRDEQKAPVQAYLDAAENPLKRGGIINLVCAGGKTVCALYIISKLAKKTLIVVHKEFLLDQWKERIAQFLPTARVGIFKAEKCEVANKDIVIGSLQSLSMKDFDSNLFGDIGLIVIDEIHRTGAEVFSRVYRKINVKYSLGLSATVQRKDGLTKVFKWHIGDIVYKGKKRKDKMQVCMKEYFDPSHLYCREHFLVTKKPNISKMINNICSFEARIDFVVDCLEEVLANEKERKVLILSDRRGHLERLKEAIDRAGKWTSGFYYGGMRQEELKESEGRQVLLATFAFSAEGLDIPKLDTLILASPKSDIIQSVGRILREKEQDRRHTPLVIDIVDNFSIFPNQAKKRVKYYNSQDYLIEWDRICDMTKGLDLVGKCYINDD